jgi:hypothetical protein
VAGRIRYFDVGRVRDKIALFVTSACIQQAFKNRRGFAFSPVFAVQRQSAKRFGHHSESFRALRVLTAADAREKIDFLVRW